MKNACIYSFDEKIVICSMSKNKINAVILTEPILILSKDDNPLSIGKKLFEALDNSSDNYPSTDMGKEIYNKIKKIAEAKSEKAFMAKTKSINVEFENNILTILPTMNKGREGFWFDMEKKIIIENDKDLNKIGEEILRALKLCS
jgi:hypothetical protein